MQRIAYKNGYTLLPDAEFGDDAKRGAELAQAFAKQNINNIVELDRINDYEWLKKKFQQG